MESRPLLAACQQSAREPLPGAGSADLHTGNRNWLAPGAGRAVFHTGSNIGPVPGAGGAVLHTGLRKKHYLCKVDNKTFNKYFSVFIMVGMTVVTILATALKFVPADTEARWLLIFAAFGSLMGVAATVASASGKIITFLFGLIDVSIYGAMCLINWKNGSSGLGNAVLHFLYFVPMQFVGFFQWRHRGNTAEGSVNARRLNGKQRWLAALLFLAGSVVAYFIIARFDKSAADTFIKTAVVLDVLPLICNIIGQLLMSTAYMEQWIFWIGVNVFSITMWAVTLKGDPGSSYALIYIIKYSFYLLNSLNGLRNWLRLSRPATC